MDEAVEALGINVLDSNGDDLIRYNDRFEALLKYTKDGVGPLVQVNVLNNVTGTNLTDVLTGAYELDLSDQLPGAYMIVFERPGSLDYILDNVLVYPTYDKAQYDFGSRTLRAGDLNHDGVIDEIDLALFGEYKNAMKGVYRDLAGRVAVNKVTAAGLENLTTDFLATESLDLTELAQIKLQYNGNDIVNGAIDRDTHSGSGIAFSTGVITYYLSRNSALTSINSADLSTDLVGSNRDKLVDLSDIIKGGGSTPSYVFNGNGYTPSEAGTGSRDNLGEYYLYGVFKYYDRQMSRSEAVDVVYRIATINVHDSVYGVDADTTALHTALTSRPVAASGASVDRPVRLPDAAGDFEPIREVETTATGSSVYTVRDDTAALYAVAIGSDDEVDITEVDITDVEPGEELIAETPSRREEDDGDDHDARRETPVFDKDDTEIQITLPEDEAQESLATEAVTSDVDRLAQYMIENGIELNSELGAALMAELSTVINATATGGILGGAGIREKYLDLDGNGMLTDSDKAYIVNQRTMTAYKSCRLDNMYSPYQVLLAPWN